MPALLGRPPPHPRAPRPVAAEGLVDHHRVVGQVVLGQQVDEQRAADRVGHLDLVGVPLLVRLEVAAPAPRHDLMGEPFLGAVEMALEQPLGDRFELDEQGGVIHGRQPTYW